MHGLTGLVVLTPEQNGRRDVLEKEMHDSAALICENMIEIRDDRLYMSTHMTWDAYCRETWGRTAQTLGNQAEHLRVVALLGDENTEVRPSHTKEVAHLGDDEKVKAIRGATKKRLGERDEVDASKLRQNAALFDLEKTHPDFVEGWREGHFSCRDEDLIIASKLLNDDERTKAVDNLRGGNSWDYSPETSPKVLEEPEPEQPELPPESKTGLIDDDGNPVPAVLVGAFGPTRDRFVQSLKHQIPGIQENALLIMDDIYGTRDERQTPKNGFRASVIIEAAEKIDDMFQSHKPRYVCECSGNGCGICRGKGWTPRK